MSDGVLSQSWHTRLCHRNHVKQLHCSRCGEKIQVGDRIHTNADNLRAALKPVESKKVRVNSARQNQHRIEYSCNNVYLVAAHVRLEAS